VRAERDEMILGDRHVVLERKRIARGIEETRACSIQQIVLIVAAFAAAQRDTPGSQRREPHAAANHLLYELGFILGGAIELCLSLGAQAVQVDLDAVVETITTPKRHRTVVIAVAIRLEREATGSQRAAASVDALRLDAGYACIEPALLTAAG